MTVSDVLPTLLEAVGGAASVPDGFDGRSQWATLTGSGDGGVTPDYVVVGLGGSLALYRAPWKLVDTDSPRLYQIMEDRLEQHDRAAEHPDIVRELKAAADACRAGCCPRPRGGASCWTRTRSAGAKTGNPGPTSPAGGPRASSERRSRGSGSCLSVSVPAEPP